MNASAAILCPTSGIALLSGATEGRAELLQERHMNKEVRDSTLPKRGKKVAMFIKDHAQEAKVPCLIPLSPY